MVELPAQERISSSVNVVTNVVGLSADLCAIPLEFVGDHPICGAVRGAASVQLFSQVFDFRSVFDARSRKSRGDSPAGE
jgi:hypothetical protein